MDLSVFRNFGYCKIEWEIQNFCMLTCSNNWKIASSEFYIRGTRPTKWRMFLQPEYKNEEDDDPLIVFCLKRMGCNDDSEPVRVNFTLTFDNYEKTHLKHTPVFESFFQVNSVFPTEIEYQSSMLNSIFLFEREVLNIQCDLLVSFDKNRDVFGSCCDLNLKELSQDLLSLYESGHASDLQLEVHNENIKAHKMILFARCKSFFDTSILNPTVEVIDMGLIHDIDALRDILRFVYSGNLKFVLEKPSISILQFAYKFGLKDVIQYYCPDRLRMSSNIHEDDYLFTWKIENFSARSEHCLEGPFLIMEKTQIRWKLIFYPVCFKDGEEYIAILAVVFGGGSLKEICVELILKNGNEYFYPKRSRKVISGEEASTYKIFFRRECILNALKDKDLSVTFRLRISTGLQKSAIDSWHTVCSFVKQKHYDNLLKNLCYLKGYLSDVTIISNESKFKANRSVLAARSPSIYNMLEGGNYLILPIEDEMLREILNFLHISRFTDENPRTHVISKLHEYAEVYEIECLKSACFRMMQDNLFIER